MATPAAPTPGVSPIAAAQDAIAHTRRHLFPFRFPTWLVLGFLAFLDQCGRAGWNTGVGRGGGGNGSPREGPDAGRGGAQVASAVETALAWLSDHVVLVVFGSLLTLLIVGALTALVLWINARGTFMYLDATATGRAEVRRPWQEHAAAANSYFAWRFGLTIAAFFALIMAGALSGGILVFLIRRRADWWSAGAVAAALAPIVLMLLIALPLLWLASVALRDFVAPLQLHSGLACGAAVGIFERLVVAHPGAFVVYLLLKIVLSLGTGVVVLIGGCLTCCIGFLPVVLQTLFQPLFFFERAWSLCLLRQMGYDLLERGSKS